MQGEGKARQVLCLPLPRWPASPACLLKLECCHRVEDKRNPSAAWRRQAKPETQRRNCKWGATRSPWGQKGGTALAAAVLCQPGLCQGSLVPACCSQDGSGEPGLQFAGPSCPQQDRVSLGLPAHQSTQKAAEKTCLFVSCLVHATVRWFRGTAGDGEEGKERAAMFFKDIATFIANQTNCPTLVTPSLRQRLASRIDVKHLKWEITN